MSKEKINVLFTACIIIISILIILFMLYLSKDCCFWNDDAHYSVYQINENYFDCLFGKIRLEHGGYYLGWFLSKFFSFGLPTLLSVHPCDFINYGHGFIKGIFTVFTLLMAVKFSLSRPKSKLLFVCIFCFLACYFFANFMKSRIIIVYYSYYRYFFCLLFWGIFWYYIQGYICKLIQMPENKLKQIFQLSGIFLCGFILGTSIETIFFTSALLVFLIFFYNFIIFIYYFLKKNNNIFKYYYFIDKKLCFSISGLFIGIILFTTTPGAVIVAKGRGMSDIHLSFDILQEFSQLYLQICIKDEMIYFIIFVILMGISFYFGYKKQELKIVIFPLLMQTAILTIMFSLVLCGKTFDEDTRDRFYLLHENIIPLYKMLILYPILLYFNYSYKNLCDLFVQKQRKKLIAIMNMLIAAFLIIFCLYYNIQIYKIIKHYPGGNIYNIKMHREMGYITEKIYLFYIEKHELPVLPDFFDLSTRALYPFWSNVNPYEKTVNNKELNKYLKKVYKKYNDEKEYEYIVTDKDNALELFYEKGGTFSEEELKNIRFSRLFDKKFVLNEK